VTNPCQAYRDALLSAGIAGGAPAEHASTCAACAAWTRSAARLVGELGSLARLRAPADLEGRVVAALQAGHRQVRAAAAVAELGRVSSPPELDQAVDADLDGADLAGTAAPARDDLPARLRVPGVLDRLVAEELADPNRARARRYLGTLRRKRAPEELRLLVAGALQSSGSTFVAKERRGTHALTLRFALGLGAAAALVGLGSLLSNPASTSAAERAPEPLVERITDPLELSPFAAALLDGASGGILSARQL
jgi:hypothetical protein